VDLRSLPNAKAQIRRPTRGTGHGDTEGTEKTLVKAPCSPWLRGSSANVVGIWVFGFGSWDLGFGIFPERLSRSRSGEVNLAFPGMPGHRVLPSHLHEAQSTRRRPLSHPRHHHRTDVELHPHVEQGTAGGHGYGARLAARVVHFAHRD